jgi:hypothetical protein
LPGSAHEERKPPVQFLSDPDPAIRNQGATEIFARGCELAREAIEKWLADDALANVFVMAGSHLPEATVGLAVEPTQFEKIWKANGSPRLADVPPDQDAKEFELEFPGGVRLDVLTTREPGGAGAIARHLLKFGESIQQVELLVKNVDEATRILRMHFDLNPLYPTTRSGAHSTRVNFFLVSAAGAKKVLIELVEAKNWSAGLC